MSKENNKQPRERWEWIESYLNGILLGEDLQEFTQQLQADPSLVEDIQAQQEMMQLMTTHEINEVKSYAQKLLRNQKESEEIFGGAEELLDLLSSNDTLGEELQVIDNQADTIIQVKENFKPKESPQNTKEEPIVIPIVPKSSPYFRVFLLRLIKVAALLSILILPVYLYQSGFLMPKIEAQQLADNHYMRPSQLSVSIQKTAVSDRISEADSLHQLANKFYREKAYSNAIEVLDLLPMNDVIFLDKGVCYFEKEDLPQAILNFKKVLEYTDEKVETDDEAHWYIALAYLKNKNKEQAQKHLKQIIQQKSWQYKTAKIMLRRLK